MMNVNNSGSGLRESAVSSQDLCWLSETDLARAIRRKKVSPVEVTRAVIAQIEKLNALAVQKIDSLRTAGVLLLAQTQHPCYEVQQRSRSVVKEGEL